MTIKCIGASIYVERKFSLIYPRCLLPLSNATVLKRARARFNEYPNGLSVKFALTDGVYLVEAFV